MSDSSLQRTTRSQHDDENSRQDLLRSHALISPAINALSEGGYISVTNADGLMVAEITATGLKRLAEDPH